MKIGISLTSSLDVGKEYLDLTQEVAKKLAKEGYGIVYGGTSYGMMAKLAETYKGSGGRNLIGVFSKELIRVTKNYKKFNRLDGEFLVETTEDRKRKILSLSDAYLILPGGYGSFEEIASVVGGQANKLFSKPIAFFNYKNYYNSLFEFFKHIHELGFSRVNPNRLYFNSVDLDKILDFFENYVKEDIPEKFV